MKSDYKTAKIRNFALSAQAWARRRPETAIIGGAFVVSLLIGIISGWALHTTPETLPSLVGMWECTDKSYCKIQFTSGAMVYKDLYHLNTVQYFVINSKSLLIDEDQVSIELLPSGELLFTTSHSYLPLLGKRFSRSKSQVTATLTQNDAVPTKSTAQLLDEADALWGKDMRVQAIAAYKTFLNNTAYGSSPHGGWGTATPHPTDKPRAYRRIIEHELEYGDASEARDWMVKALGEDYVKDHMSMDTPKGKALMEDVRKDIVRNNIGQGIRPSQY